MLNVGYDSNATENQENDHDEKNQPASGWCIPHSRLCDQRSEHSGSFYLMSQHQIPACSAALIL